VNFYGVTGDFSAKQFCRRLRGHSLQQDSQCMRNVYWRRVRAKIVAVEKQ